MSKIRFTCMTLGLLLSVAVTANAGTFKEETAFGDNPASLRMFTYAPDFLPKDRPLVVVMHGCMQGAADAYRNTGWSALADAQGFALLLPQQVATNNPTSCFNWFMSENQKAGHGEPASIRAMIARMEQEYGVKSGKIYISGLSAGAAMTAIMLATYPEVFAAGAIMAGPAYRCADNAMEAMECMWIGRPGRTAEEWGAAILGATSYRGPWPRVSIWNGSSDTVVSPQNLVDNRKQWLNVNGIDDGALQNTTVTGTITCSGSAYSADHAVFSKNGQSVVETWVVKGAGHGVSIDSKSQCGFNRYDACSVTQTPTSNGYNVDTGLCAVRLIADFWGLK